MSEDVARIIGIGMIYVCCTVIGIAIAVQIIKAVLPISLTIGN